MDDTIMAVDDNSENDPYEDLYVTPEIHIGNGDVYDGAGTSDDVNVLKEENKKLAHEAREYKKLFENMRIKYNSLKRDHNTTKKKLRKAIDRITGGPGLTDEELLELDRVTRWKEHMIQSAMKIKSAVGVNTYKQLIKDGELQLPSLRTITRYLDNLKRTGGSISLDFSNIADESSNEFKDMGAEQGNDFNLSDTEDPVTFTAVPDISYYQQQEDDDEDEQPSEINNDMSLMTDASFNVAQREEFNKSLSQEHLEFLKTMTGYRKKWTPFEIKTCTDIRRIIGSKEYEVLRKQEGMPLPSVKTLRKYKHCCIENGDDNTKAATLNNNANSGPKVSSAANSYALTNDGFANSSYLDDTDDILAQAEEPDGHFDINSLTEQQIDFLQSLSGNTKGFSNYELQKSLELKNELGGDDYEILRKQECLHIPTLEQLLKYEKDNGLEEAAVAQYVERNVVNVDPDQPTFDMSKLEKHHIEFLNTLPENPKRWTNQMIDSALDIRQSVGTRDYEALRRQGVPLPAARTLRRHKDV